MLREYKKLLDAVHILVTGLLAVASYAVLYSCMQGRPQPLRPFAEYGPSIAIFVFALMASLWRRGFSAAPHFVRPVPLLRELAVGYAFGIFAYAFAAYAFKIPHLSRLFIFGGMALSFIPAAVWHLAAYRHYRNLRSKGWDAKRVLLVGEGFKELPAIPGLEIAATITALESEDSLPKMLDRLVVDCAIFTSYRQNPALVEKIMLACQERGIEVWLKPDFIHEGIRFSRFDYFNDMPLFVFSQAPRPGAALLIKHVFDRLAALVLLALLSAPMLAVAALIRATSPGAAVFKQLRLGLNGRPFSMYKFRSMWESAEGELAKKSLPNELRGPVFKMMDDPRITPIGKLLRKYSADELPQFWNVLIGQMSLVGPRPPLPSEVNLYEGWQRRRLSMRPGITGLWQVGGRNEIADFNDRVKLDLEYIDHWSLLLDLKILIKTVRVVLKGTGS